MNHIRNIKSSSRFMERESAAVASKQVRSSCGCASVQTTSAARYDEDGECASTTAVSCETQWQMRDCLKFALCEFLVCIADEFCVNGKFQTPVDENGNEKDLGDILLCCLGNTACTVVHCLPTAICGPKQDKDCIPPPPALECNFAVEDKD